MPFEFPNSPTNGEYANGFIWNAANQTWDSAIAPRAATVPISSPNYIINGAFEINQRGFTSTTASDAYGFDRWRLGSSGGTATYSAQTFTVGDEVSSNVPSSSFARLATSGQSAAGDFAGLNQRIEDVKTLAGQAVTLSFWAKASSGTPKIALSVEQTFGTGGSTTVVIAAGQVTLTTAWARYSVTVTLPTISGKTIGAGNHLGIWMFTSGGSSISSYVGTLGAQNITVDFWGVQLEAGAAATAFRRNAPSIQGELAACQRYFYQISRDTAESAIGMGIYYSNTQFESVLTFPVTMRNRPTLTQSNITGQYRFYRNGTVDDFSTLTIGANGLTSAEVYNITEMSGTAGQAGFLTILLNGAWLAFSAEL